MRWRSVSKKRALKRALESGSWQPGATVAGGMLAAFWLLWRQWQARRPLRGQVALVTGGSRCLGFALARELLRQGCRVAICARDSQELERARRDLEIQAGGEVFARPCDVANPTEVNLLVAEVIDRFGRIDLLFNNAGIIQVAPLENMELSDFHNAMNVNFWGQVHAAFAVLPHMRRQGRGRIVNITSIGGKVAVPHLLPYDCAKFAAVGFSEGLRAELAADGVGVTTVVPGLMRTGSYRFAETGGDREREYAWFSLLSRTPGLAMDVDKAVRRIIRAAKRGRPEVVIGLPAKVLRMTKELFPRPTLRALSVAERLLPNPQPS